MSENKSKEEMIEQKKIVSAANTKIGDIKPNPNLEFSLVPSQGGKKKRKTKRKSKKASKKTRSRR